ncbi:kinase-like protein, partial [Schizopora paradoxa]
REAVLWKMTNHPNVLPFVGLFRFKDMQGRIALVSPWMRNGNLLSYARKRAGVDRANLLAQAARGLLYLHAVNIIHGDLKCANIMVNDEGSVQLADFGLATVESVRATVTGSMSSSAGNPRWLAPELMFPEMFGGGGKSTRESDAYSFGMTALELFTEQVPFYDLAPLALPFEVAVNGLEPSWPGPDAEARGMTPDIWNLMRSCWKRDPSSRSEVLRVDLADFATSVVEIIRPNPRGIDDRDVKMLMRKIRGKTDRRGWFRNVWDVELLEDALLGRRSVSARIINASVLDSARVRRLFKSEILQSLTNSSFRATSYGIRCTGVEHYNTRTLRH